MIISFSSQENPFLHGNVRISPDSRAKGFGLLVSASLLASAVAAELHALHMAYHTQSCGSLESFISKVVISHVIIIGRRGRREAVAALRLACLVLQPEQESRKNPEHGQ